MTEQRDIFSVAFLDVLSCALGATVILFLVFAVLDHEGARESQLDQGIDLQDPVVATTDSVASDIETPALFMIDLQITELGATSATQDAIYVEGTVLNDAPFRLTRMPHQNADAEKYLLLVYDAPPSVTDSIELSVRHAGAISVSPLSNSGDPFNGMYEAEGIYKLRYSARGFRVEP